MTGSGDAVPLARLHEMGAAMARETGAHLFVQVVEEGASCMDWHTVSVASEVLARGERAVWTVLRHEWYHRLVSPRSREHGTALALELSASTGISFEEAAEVVNIGCDLWVDDAVLAEGGWGSDLYFEELRHELHAVGRMILRTAPGPAGEGVALVVEGMLHVQVERASQHGRERLIPAPSAVARRILGYFFDASISESERLLLLYRDLRALLGDAWDLARLRRQLAQLMWKTARLLLASAAALEGLDLPRMAQELSDLGVGLDQLEAPFGATSDVGRLLHRLRCRMRRLTMYPQVIRAVDRSLRGRRQTADEGWRSWGLGDPRRRLDPVASVRRNGAIIPGVTTLQAAFGRRARPSRGGVGAHICLVIDDSGSTSGDVNQCEVEMALGVVETARSFGDAVSLVVFGSSVTAAVERSRDYESLANRIAGLSGDSGGTALAPALIRAQAMVDRAPRFTSQVLVMTDTGVFDMKATVRAFVRLSRDAGISVFCFAGESEMRPFLDHLRHLRRTAVYLSPVGKGFREAAMRQVMASAS